jgi:hypothetical protein
MEQGLRAMKERKREEEERARREEESREEQGSEGEGRHGGQGANKDDEEKGDYPEPGGARTVLTAADDVGLWPGDIDLALAVIGRQPKDPVNPQLGPDWLGPHDAQSPRMPSRGEGYTDPLEDSAAREATIFNVGRLIGAGTISKPLPPGIDFSVCLQSR